MKSINFPDFKSINGLKSFFLGRKKERLKVSLSILAIGQTIGAVFAYIIPYILHLTSTAPHSILALICFLFFLLALFVSATSFMISLISLGELIKALRNKFNCSDLNFISEHKINHVSCLDFYKNKTNIINLLLSVSIQINKPNVLNLETIKQVQDALIYNESILEQVEYHRAPTVVQKKIDENIKLIMDTIGNALYEINTKKLIHHPDFQNLLENINFKEKLNQKLALEHHDLIKKQKEEESEQIQKKVILDEIKKLENQYYKKVEDNNLLSDYSNYIHQSKVIEDKSNIEKKKKVLSL